MKENSSVMKHFRNSYIAYSELTTFIVASVCNVLILQANTFIDAVIVGNFVSTDAMAVVNLFSPLLSVIVMVPALLAEGAMVAGSRALGQQDYEQVNRTFMVNLVGGLFFALALALSISLLAEPLISLHTEDARLVPLALDYLPVAAFIGVSFVIQNSYTVFLQLSGKARLVVRVTIALMVINLLLDLLLIIGFGWGLTGAVLATIGSYLLSLVMIVPEVRRQWRIFALRSVCHSWFLPLTRRCAALGLSDAAGNLVMAIIFSGVNGAALRLYGADGVIVISVFMQMLSIGSLVTMGVIFSVQSLGMAYLGEMDLRGYRMVIGRGMTIVIVCMSLISLVMALFPDMIIGSFGASDQLIAFARKPLMILSTTLLPFALLICFCSIYVTQGRVALSTGIILLEPLFILIPAWMFERYCQEAFWWFFPVGVTLVLGGCLVAAWIISRRSGLIDRFTLAPRYVDAPYLDFSVKYDEEDVQAAMGDIMTFLDVYELSASLRNRISVCTEDIMYSLVSRHQQEKESQKGLFDIRVMEMMDEKTRESQGIQMFVKTRGKSYNPVQTCAADTELLLTGCNLAMLLVNRLSDGIDYNYRNGVNCTVLKFYRKNEEK